MQVDPPHVASLRDHIQSLEEVHSNILALRQFPPLLLRPPVSNGISAAIPSLHAEFQQLKNIGETLRSVSIQDALRIAHDSEKADDTDLNTTSRRECRKRRRPPSPESPKPYVSFQRKTPSLFPIHENEQSPLQVDGLVDYIREFNKLNKSKLHIWTRTKASGKFDNPVIVRFTIRDVLTAYVTLGYPPDGAMLVAECITAFAPRERKSPHSQSDYVTYQNLSQQIARILQSHPNVSFQNIMSLLCSYEGIFVDRCTSCERVLSAEGHVPPVVRIWIDAGKEGERGRWDPRHVTCQA